MSLKRYRDWAIQYKIMIVPLVTLVTVLFAVELLVVPFLEERVMESRKATTKQAVEVAYGFLEGYGQEVKAGRMSLAMAQQASLNALRPLRYQGKGYFWINDLTPKMVMHPTKPDLDGKDLADNRDPKDKRLFVEFVKVCREKGAGFVEYLWPKPEGEKPIPKVSYVKLYAPWGWIIGSGVYLEDVAKDSATLKWWIHGSALLVSLIMVFFSAWVGLGISRTLGAVIGQLREMTHGNADLTQRIRVTQNDEAGQLGDAFNHFLENLQKVIGNVRKCSTNVAVAAFDIRTRADEITQGAQTVASEAATVATAGEEMAATANVIANNCNLAVDASKTTRTFAKDGSTVVDNTMTVMRQIAEQVESSATTVGVLGERSNQIGDIIGTIEDIADQTNLLALNAAIEAARAGEMGRGFAVVADEVRALAERTTKATKEITGMIKAIQSETSGAVVAMNQGVLRVNEGTGEAQRSREALGQIVNQVDQVTDQINQIAQSAAEQTSTTHEISSNIDRITELAGKECAQASSLAAAAAELNRLAEEMISSVNQFQTIIKWNNWMTVKVSQFDEAHKTLIGMIGKLNDAFAQGKGETEIMKILSGLAEYCVGHFADEERLMKEHGYPAYPDHKKIHDTFVQKVSETIVEFENHRVSPASIMELLSEWLMGHILKVDKEYADFFAKKGVR